MNTSLKIVRDFVTLVLQETYQRLCLILLNFTYFLNQKNHYKINKYIYTYICVYIYIYIYIYTKRQKDIRYIVFFNFVTVFCKQILFLRLNIKQTNSKCFTFERCIFFHSLIQTLLYIAVSLTCLLVIIFA